MGLDFVVCDILNNVGSNTDKYYLITTGTLYPDAAWHIVSTPGAVIKLFEGPTVSDNGTTLDIISLNREFIPTPTATVYADPTVTVEGTLLYKEQIGTSTTSGKGGQYSRSEMDQSNFKLNASSSYLFKVTTLASSTDISINFIWQELSF